MSAALSWLAVLVAIGIGAWFIRKSGSDAAQKGAATDALNDIADANHPATDDELKRVREKYRRD